MDAVHLQDLTATPLLPSISAANTAAATSGNAQWTDISTYEGDMVAVINVGAITGTVTPKLQCADDANGTNPVDITGAALTAINATGVAFIAIDRKSATKKFVGIVGTVVTGPVLFGAVLIGRKKYI